MGRKMILFLSVMIVVTLLTGCWSRRELNTLGIVVGMGIDKSGNDYEVSIQMIDPSEIASQKKGGSGRAPFIIFSSKGSTIAEAIRKLTTIAPRKAYFSYVRIFIISEQLAEEGISKPLDYLSRNQEFRSDFYFAIARGTSAKHVLSGMSNLEKISGNKMYATLEIAEREWSPVTTIKLNELVKRIVGKGKNPVITGFHIKGDIEASKSKQNVETTVPAALLQTSGLAVFREDRMVGWLNETESKGFTNITNHLHHTAVKVACPDEGSLAVEVVHAETKIKGQVVNEEPQVEVMMRVEANISDAECQIDLTKAETIADLEKAVSMEIIDHNEAAVRRAKKLRSDIFGFGDAIHRADPAYWNKVKNEWDLHFTDIPTTFKVNVKIRHLGAVRDSHVNKMKE